MFVCVCLCVVLGASICVAWGGVCLHYLWIFACNSACAILFRHICVHACSLAQYNNAWFNVMHDLRCKCAESHNGSHLGRSKLQRTNIITGINLQCHIGMFRQESNRSAGVSEAKHSSNASNNNHPCTEARNTSSHNEVACCDPL